MSKLINPTPKDWRKGTEPLNIEQELKEHKKRGEELFKAAKGQTSYFSKNS